MLAHGLCINIMRPNNPSAPVANWGQTVFDVEILGTILMIQMMDRWDCGKK
jgi:hypothetical protein